MIFMGTALMLVLALGLLLFSGCAITGRAVEKPSDETIKIGVICPLSGANAYLGEYVKEGLELFIEEQGSKVGFGNRRIQLVFEDSQSDPKTAISAYQKLTAVEGIKIIIPIESHITMALAPLAERDHVLLFTVGGASPRISEAGDYVFRHNLLPQDEASFLANFIYNDVGVKKIGLVVANSESGISWVDLFIDTYEGLGGVVAAKEVYGRSELDFRTFILKLNKAGVKDVVLASYLDQAAGIMKQSQEYGYEFSWYAPYVIESPKLLVLAGGAEQGIRYSHFIDGSSPLFVEYDSRYRERYNHSSDPYAALAYDSISILSRVISECGGGAETGCLKNYLYGLKDYAGVTGNISFDSNGDTRKGLIIKTVRNGEFVRYE